MSMNQHENIDVELPVHPALKKHADSLTPPQVIKVRDHVYVAFGYALANMILIEGRLFYFSIITTYKQ